MHRWAQKALSPTPLPQFFTPPPQFQFLISPSLSVYISEGYPEKLFHFNVYGGGEKTSDSPPPTMRYFKICWTTYLNFPPGSQMAIHSARFEHCTNVL